MKGKQYYIPKKVINPQRLHTAMGEQDRQRTYNVTLRHVHMTTVTVEKQ
jgi:hypothetical protein